MAVACTYSIVADDDGLRYLQIDTYSSKMRKIAGKKSQSVHFAPEAIAQLKTILLQECFRSTVCNSKRIHGQLADSQ